MIDFVQKLKRRASVAAELIGFLRDRRAYWLIPLVLALTAVGFFFFVASQPAVTPFVYTLF